MREKKLKKTDCLFRVWLAVTAALCICFSLNRSLSTGSGAGRSFGILLFILLDILFLLVYATENVYWISGISFEQAQKAGRTRRRNYAAKYLLVFLIMTALYLVYCFAPQSFWSHTAIRDSLAAGGAICAAALLTTGITL